MLRVKTLLYIFVIISLLFVSIDFVARSIILRSVFAMEHEEALGHLARVMAAYDNELSRLDSIALDWGYWDDAYDFLSGNNPTFVAENLAGDAGVNLRIDYMLFLNTEHQYVDGRAFNVLEARAGLSPAKIEAITAIRWTNPSSPYFGVKGLILLDGRPVMFAARNVLPSDSRGPAIGVILVGRILDVNYLSEIVLLELDDSPIVDGVPPSIAGIGALSLGNVTFVHRMSESTNVAYKVLADVKGAPILLLRAYIQRNLSAIGSATVRNIRIAFGLVSAVLFLALLMVLDKTILRKLSRLSSRVEQIGQRGSVCQRVEVRRERDELSSLAANINDMLDRQDKFHSELADRENTLRLITDNMLDVICQVDAVGDVRYATPSFATVLGYDLNAVVGKAFTSFVQQQDSERILAAVNKVVRADPIHKLEFRFLHADGHEVWVESVGRAIFDEDGLFAGGVVCAREIIDRKKMEERLRQMGMYDALTGLYNRASFEDAMQETNLPGDFALIVCDVDGLKVVNDNMGHEAGDKFLKVAASVIRSSFREEDFIARIGGDEFAILLRGHAARNAAEAVRRLRDAIETHNKFATDTAVSLSVGYASTVETAREALFKVADDTMYREKLNRRQNTHSTFINILSKALEARDFIAEGHAERLRGQVSIMGEALGLPEHKIAELCLLAQFHDIGKVGVSDSILFKTAPLDPEERKEMQKHCEIGHRIAFSSPDLMPIADWILKHHEWWNGNGYPFGLAQEEIPLECRILAIADAYDAMTNDRPYRKALSHEEALNEIKNNAGKQFDPQLAKLFVEQLLSKNNISWGG